MRIAMIVPTYWSRPAAQGWREGDLVFDHPTPLDGADTLGRLLRSLSLLEDRDFELALVVVPTTPQIEEETVARVRGIADEADVPVPIRLLTPAHMRRLGELLGPAAERCAPLLSLSGYPHVRNACLLAARLLEADVAVLIDDDELFEDPAFMRRVRQGIGSEHDGRRVVALAGYYLNADGGYLLEKPATAWDASWPKFEKMNRAFEEIIGRPPRYKRTPFAFGGNFTLHRDLYAELPFDTRVTRGEDLDYLMMAAAHGVPTVLDSELAIKHLAPPKSHPFWQQVRQDVIRFAYQRAKIRALAAGPREGMNTLAPGDLDPYPGFFLRDDLDERVAETARLLAESFRLEGDEEGAREALRAPEFARRAAQADDPIAFFLDLKERWRELMSSLREDRFRGLLG